MKINETGTVGIPNSYFLKMAKHDYEDYQCALPREFFQNSIDAGATEIWCKFYEEFGTIIIEDNGCGMSLDVLKNKLLVLGGSHKLKGSVGAFGKAKELLFFSWTNYKIETGNLVVDGVGAQYTIKETDKHIKGTTCTITIPDSENFGRYRDYFNTVAGLIQTRTKIYINDHLVICRKPRGKKVRHIEGVGDIHQLKKNENPYMDVRINGIWMFSQYIGRDMGELVLELDGTSLNVLTSNRDGFKWEVRSKVERLIQDLTTNKAQALKQKKKEIVTTIKGNGAVVVGEEEMAVAKSKVEAGDNFVAIVDRVFKGVEATPIQQYRIGKISRATGRDWTEVKNEIEFIGYEPDFRLKYEQGKNPNIEKFMKSKKARLLATMWTEVLKQIFMDNKRYIRFRAGFIFDGDVEAQLHQSGGEVTIYLNPNCIKTSEHRFVIVEDLKDLAIHEIAHLSYSNHDNDFVNTMANIRKQVTRADQKPYSVIQRVHVK